MVFGLFSAKSQLPQSTSLVQQLRTPSPSIDSASNLAGSHSPLHRPLTIASPAPHPPATPSPPPAVDLHALLLAIPPKTLHTYTLSHLDPSTSSRPPSPSTLQTLQNFFSTLTPPPVLHCVRCHKSYYEVENDDRSCLVGHDDDSAEVERVGKATGGYETLWGCCGKTVEGDGDMGPPDGWCYEGKHTMDTKRARFRADSTIYDDKLTSCLELHCHRNRRTSRKRTRPSDLHEFDSEDDLSEGERDSGIEDIVSKKKSVTIVKKERQGKKGKGKAMARDSDEMEMDRPLNESDSAVGSIPSPKPKSKSRSKPKSPPKSKSKEEKPISPRIKAKPKARKSGGVEVLSGASEAEGGDEKPKKKRKV